MVDTNIRFFLKRWKDLESFYLNSEKGIRITDTSIASGTQISISFVGAFITTRESDGHVDLPLNNWSFCLSYDIDNYTSIPIKLNIAEHNINGYFWQN